jgi:hypothetical protein
MRKIHKFNVLNESGAIIDASLNSSNYINRKNINNIDVINELTKIVNDSWGCSIKKEQNLEMALYSAEPKMNSQYKKIWFIFKKLTPALRRDPNEYRCQIADIKIIENKKINLLEMNIYNFKKELFLPIGIYNQCSINDGPFIFSIIDPSRIGHTAKNRSYYVDLKKISEAWYNGFSFHFDINGYLTISMRKESFPAIIEYLEYFYKD